MNYKYIMFLCVALLISSCALYEPKYREEFNEATPNEGEIEKTFYLIGDAGYAKAEKSTPALTILKKYLSVHPQKGNYTIFLGDNIYPDGMPKKDAKDREIAEHRLDVQIEAVQDFGGQVYFIPGNHDWYNEGLKGLEREEKYFEDRLDDKKLFKPKTGCALESIEISENIQLIILDSQWYLEDWDQHPTINDNCSEIKTREAMFLEVESELKKNQNKTILFALHHPLYTNGVHGGQYAPVKHLFPSQKKIPLPILGSLAMQIRTAGGISTQDNQNKQYKSLVKRLETLAKGAERIIFASGHEHSLQYIEHEGIKQIVSGAGAKNSYATLSNDGLFAYGGQGFAKLDIYKNGSTWVSYYGNRDNEPYLLYSKEIYGSNVEYDLNMLPPKYPATIQASVYEPESNEKTDFYESIWGDHYRDVYGTKIEARVAILDTLYGGLEVVRKGGGHQTRSLRLKAKDGREYNMRALKKSGVKFLQSTIFKDNYVEESLENTVSEDILKDFYTASHPYIFTVIPMLSDAVGVFHTNPKIYYVPKQKALGKFNIDHGDELYMIVERPEENHKNLSSFGKPDDIESTSDVYERLRRDEKYKIEESSYIRARLFDMLIGDWDRHEDQWRWAEYELENGDHIFKPIPRDRDQAFSNFDGGFMGALRGLFGFANQFQRYDAELKDVKWLNTSATRLDRTLIKNSGRGEWLEQARFIKENLSDEIIDKAFENIPSEAKGEDLQHIKHSLKERRNNITDIANRYYNYLSDLVIVTGTDKDDYVDIERQENGKTKITIYRIKKGKKADIVSDRVYHKKDTKEIWIYALDDDDSIAVHGKPENPIKLRIIGGQNNDIYNIKKGRRVKVYDHKSKPNTVEKRGGATFKFTDNYRINHFNKDEDVLKTTSIIPAVGFNPDDGLRIGPTGIVSIKGFQQNPFTATHKISGGYYFATQGFDLEYKGEFSGVLGDYNLLIGGRYTSPNFAVNFFGFGNDTDNNQDDFDFDYNRVKLSTYRTLIGAVKNGRLGSYFEYTASFEGIKVDDTPDRFITTEVDFDDPEIFDRKWFAGLDGTYRYESYDVNVNPTRGMKFEVNVGGRMNVENTERTFGYIKPHLSFYNALSRNRKWVLKTAAQGQFNIGRLYEFYQSAQIGGENLLRGYRNQRFSGQSSLAGSADIRYSFDQFKTRVLPLQIGLFTGVDTGRVWLADTEDRNQWHSDVGGGFWINSADAINSTFNLFFGEDGARFSFAFAFKF
ncbi:metallophosphoesterase [Aquimarina spongiae]|uniref:Hemolysin activation/secretion protein n=1 Tax=Aquimarina spongiae TaxID=570521 RepID=A0A1M6GKM5_9FLAO|nr:metallophosphoesterase [Aquimarina spongiae]SHJ10479.1 Hemolysin activation/secretion protein [Aquimarina spongiae]